MIVCVYVCATEGYKGRRINLYFCRSPRNELDSGVKIVVEDIRKDYNLNPGRGVSPSRTTNERMAGWMDGWMRTEE